ncbi:MAG: TetR/AcrR family transcriptional regulator [Geminicoccaceae bacterium]
MTIGGRHFRIGETTARAKQKQRTRERILASARELFSELGYEDTTVRRIAEHAGVSVGSVISHFDAKADLLNTIIDEELGHQIEQVRKALPRRGDTADRLLMALRLFYVYSLELGRLAAVFLAYSWMWSSDADKAYRERIAEVQAIFGEILRDGIARGDVDADAPIDVAVRALWAVYIQGLRQPFFDDEDADTAVTNVEPQVLLLLRALRPGGDTGN